MTTPNKKTEAVAEQEIANDRDAPVESEVRVQQYKTAIALLLAFILGMAVSMTATSLCANEYGQGFDSGNHDYRNNIFPQRNYDPYPYPGQPHVHPDVEQWGNDMPSQPYTDGSKRAR